MVDPISSGAMAKAVGSATSEMAKEAGGLFSRVLGPAADELGAALARYTAFRVGNAIRIAERADAKGAGGRPGEVPPRVAHKLLEEGSYCDDELMGEYLGGVLAASRSPGGRDDRGVAWSDMVTRLSSLQVRAHFLLYREWAARLNGRTDLNLASSTDRRKVALLLDLAEFARLLVHGHEVPVEQALNHAMFGLERTGLISPDFSFGSPEHVGGLLREAKDSAHRAVLTATPSAAGMELYGWAQGEAGMTGKDFVMRARSFAEDEIPRLRAVDLPRLRATGEAVAGS